MNSNFQHGRIILTPETRLHREPLFDVVMIGHAGKDVDLTRLFANNSIVRMLQEMGYSEELDRLRKTGAASDPLYLLPVPVHSVEEFNDLFSIKTSANDEIRYTSRLGGDNVWLPEAVKDFFQAEVLRIPRRLWVVAVDERLGVEAFLSNLDTYTLENNIENALMRALNLPNAGVLCLPDFERLHISPALRHIPALRIENPVPAFLPCGTNTDDGVKERNEVFREQLDISEQFIANLQRIMRVVSRYRPDINVVMAFPYDKNMDGEVPKVSETSASQLAAWQNHYENDSLRHVQLTYPFLIDVDGNLSSPCGILAAKMLSSSTHKGSWRSIAGIDLTSLKNPFPTLSSKEASRLREGKGLAVLCVINGKLQLDDERLPVAYVKDQAATNSGELARFMGWLRRSLEKLGLDLLFESQATALKSEILLRQFFGRLYELGALNGKKAEDAFRVSSRTDGDSGVIVDIEIASALAIDRLVLDFRLESSGIQQWEVRRG